VFENPEEYVVSTNDGINAVVTHTDPDIDDGVGIYGLKRYGSKVWRGIENAEIRTTSERVNDPKVTEELEKSGIIYVGIGGGRYDEHPVGEKRRQDRESAATLVAKHLGIDMRASLGAILDYGFAKNYSADTGHFEIGPLFKLAFRHLTHTTDESLNERMKRRIFDALFLFLDAIHADAVAEEQKMELLGNVTRSMDEITAVWLLKTFRPGIKPEIAKYIEPAKIEKKSISRMVARDLGRSEDKTLYWILEYARENQSPVRKRPDITSFELAYLVELAQRYTCVGKDAKKSRKEIAAAAEIFLTAQWKKDSNFHIDCKKDFESKATRSVTLKGPLGEEIKITSVVSSEPEIPKYCRAREGGRASVVIKFDPKTRGFLVVFDKKSGINPAPIIADLRQAERLYKKIQTKLPRSVLENQGTVPGAEEWYFDGYSIFNGSLTTKVTPTKLPRERIEGIVMGGIRIQLQNKGTE
jgi:hypothetical protein